MQRGHPWIDCFNALRSVSRDRCVRFGVEMATPLNMHIILSRDESCFSIDASTRAQQCSINPHISIAKFGSTMTITYIVGYLLAGICS